MEPIKCSEEMDKFFSRLAEFKKWLKESSQSELTEETWLEEAYDKLHEFFKVEGEE